MCNFDGIPSNNNVNMYRVLQNTRAVGSRESKLTTAAGAMAPNGPIGRIGKPATRMLSHPVQYTPAVIDCR